jgi:hypothetical protein
VTFARRGFCKMGFRCKYKHVRTRDGRILSPDEQRRSAGVCRYYLLGLCRKGRACQYSHDAASLGGAGTGGSEDTQAGARRADAGGAKEKTGAKGKAAAAAAAAAAAVEQRASGRSLLRSLLAPEVIRERSYLLQCICYMVREGFFVEPAAAAAGAGTAETSHSSSTESAAVACPRLIEEISEDPVSAPPS